MKSKFIIYVELRVNGNLLSHGAIKIAETHVYEIACLIYDTFKEKSFMYDRQQHYIDKIFIAEVRDNGNNS